MTKALRIHVAILACLVAATIAQSVNIYNSAIYADAHALNGASVGWFAPYGMLVLLLFGITTIVYGFSVYVHYRT